MRDRLFKKLRRLASDDLKAFFNLINDVAGEFNKFVPFLLDKGKPKTEEEKERERKWLDEQRKISEYEDEYPYEILAFTRRDGDIVLIAHGSTEKELFSNISEAVKTGSYDNKNECIFFEGRRGPW